MEFSNTHQYRSSAAFWDGCYAEVEGKKWQITFSNINASGDTL
jgi:hypothetical protein